MKIHDIIDLFEDVSYINPLLLHLLTHFIWDTTRIVHVHVYDTFENNSINNGKNIENI